MSAKTIQVAPSTNGRAGVAPPPGQALPVHHRPRSLVAVGVLMVAVAALVVAILYTRAGGKVSVIVVAKPVPVGATITRDDLKTAQLPPHSVPAYAASHLDRVVGQVAAVGLVTGQVLNPDMVSSSPSLAADAAVVGVAVKPGQLPADGLRAGDTVMVVVLPVAATGAGGSGTPSVLSAAAPVVGSVDLPAGSGSIVSVQVLKSQAATLAFASSGGLVALVKVGG